MQDTDKLYEDLAAHLDRLPAGFPRTATGVEMRILRRLFTPEQAILAMLTTLKPETPEEIAARSGRNPEELAAQLEALSRKGLIFRIRKDGKAFYRASQFVIGIWEFHVNDLDPEFIRDANEYFPHFFKEGYQPEIPPLRTIPISRALPSEQAVMPYEKAREIIMEQDKILVAPCICRKEHHITGHGCDKPVESCLVFGLGAEYYEENGLGRQITREEALEILEKAETTGLVLQPSNARTVTNICTCCGCCCQILIHLKSMPNPSECVASNYFAAVDADLCSGCGTCATRCQMDAVSLIEDTAAIDLNRCIGCGLCVPTCPEEAVRLELKSAEVRKVPPPHMMDTYKQIAVSRMRKSGKRR